MVMESSVLPTTILPAAESVFPNLPRLFQNRTAGIRNTLCAEGDCRSAAIVLT